MIVPNVLTTIRIVLALPLFLFLLHQQYQAALWVAILAGATDLLDGYIARAYGMQTRLGSYLDPTADKLVVFAAYLALMINAAVPSWLFQLILLRDLVIAFGVLYLVLRRKLKRVITPPHTGKVTVAFQIGLAILSIMNLNYNLHLNLEPLCLVAGCLTIFSLLYYVRLGWGFANAPTTASE